MSVKSSEDISICHAEDVALHIFKSDADKETDASISNHNKVPRFPTFQSNSELRTLQFC